MLIIYVITALNWFLGFESLICGLNTKNTFLRYLEAKLWLLVCCSGEAQDVIPQISFLPYFSDQNHNFTGLFAEIYLERVPDSNFGETTSCVTIIVVIKFK